MIELGELAPERPAVVDLLVNRGKPSGNAVAATVLDLASRGHLELEQVAPGQHVCRLSPESIARDQFEPFEERVVQLLRSRAVDGVVPAESLTVGIEQETTDWWIEFRAEVTSQAREVGLVQGRAWQWTRLVVFGLGVVAALAASAYSAASESVMSRVLYGLGLAAAVAFGLIAEAAFDGVSLTRSGRRSRARWRAIGARLGSSDGFVDIPPSGVVVWNGYLAYAAALGLAPTACRALPVGPDSTRVAWVRRGGEWRRVRLRIPRRFFPPGWGRAPLLAAATGVVGVAAAMVILLLAVRSGEWHPAPPLTTEAANVLGELEPALAGIAFVVLVFSLWEVALALIDLVSTPIVVTGPVVARSVRRGGRFNPWADLVIARGSIAVDDGASSSLTGRRVDDRLFRAFRRGDVVSIRLDRRLGHVRSLEVVTPWSSEPARR